MKLRSKILLPVGAVLIALILGMHHLSTTLLLQGFTRVEEDAMRVNVSRVDNALNECIEQLSAKSSDWSIWDDTVQFVHDHNEAFVKSNISPLAMANIQVDGMVLTDTKDRVAVDVSLGKVNDQDALIPDLNTSLLRSYPFLSQHKNNESVHAGLLQTAHGPMLVASRPILNSQGTGEIQGTLIFTRRLDDALIDSLQKRTKLRASIRRIGDMDMPADFNDAIALIGTDRKTLVRPIDDDLIAGYSVINDMQGKPLLAMRVDSRRNEYRWGQMTIHYLLISLIAVAVISSIVVVVLIEKVILRRLAYLASQVVRIGKSSDASGRVSVSGEDELAVLGDEMNHMLASLERAHKEREELARKLVETSRQAGMAEVATGILHNVGNVLNSVNVSTNLIAEKLRQSKVQNLGKAIELIRNNKTRLAEFLSGDARGKELPEYLVRVSEFLAQEHEAMLSEVQALGGSIDHIKQIVAAQQSFAKTTTACSHFDLSAAAEDAIRMNLHALQHSRVEIQRSFELVKPVYADRHMVMQILMNLINNAEKALRHVPESVRNLRIEISEFTHDRTTMARVRIIDSGNGIAPQNISKIFSFGFTTKKDGHGFGLHASANAARQMRGALTAHSDGEGKGAVFTLELPLQPAEVIT